ncbi:hypothetical protein ACPCKL_02420 [Streptomyces cellulosae]
MQSPAFRAGERGLLVTGSDDRTARLWRLPGHGSRHRPYGSVSSPVTSTACTPSPSSTGTTLVTGRLRQVQPLQRLQGRIALNSRVNKYLAGSTYAREGDHWDITYYHGRV